MDITNYEQVEKIVTTYEPDVIFHCAAWTAVDKAEYMEENCRLVNVVGTKNLVEATKRVGAKFIYISTDYVFDGEKEGMYDISDEVNPKSIYGKTKYEGEVETRKYEKYFVVRTSWVFGENGNNFIKTMMSQYGKRDEVTVVDDQFGSPTFTKDLARLLVDMSETEKYGTYHANNEGFCSWYEFTKEIYRLAGYDIKVTPVSTEKYYEGKDMSKIAYRPKNSRLSKQCLIDQGFKPLPSWQDATEYYVHLLKNKERDGE